MKMNEQEIQHIAALAKLEISAEKTAEFTEAFNQMVDFADLLADVSVENAVNHSELCNVLREDAVVQFDLTQHLLNIAPQTSNHCFVVPKFMD